MFLRVVEPGRAAFQLRKGEEGVSVFDTEALDPILTEEEVGADFRPDSLVLKRTREEIEAQGLRIVAVPGTGPLSGRLRLAHAEIRPGPGMTRAEFKKALQELE
jgi:hypothetical protein